MKTEPPPIPRYQQQPQIVIIKEAPKKGFGILRILGLCLIAIVALPVILGIVLAVASIAAQKSKATAPTTVTPSSPARTVTPSPKRTVVTSPAPATPAPAPVATPPPQLILLDWSWQQEHESYVKAEGQVKNTSSQSLRNVEALLQFYTADGKFISSESALIEFTTLLPDQTSPFKVLGRWNPEMKKASIQFKTLFGSPIRWEQKDDAGKQN